MITYRPFKNGDAPELVELWNRASTGPHATRPLSVYDFDALVMGSLVFERPGLIVAERDGHLIGFAHAGFGPKEPAGPSHRLDRTMGAVVMLAAEPGPADPELECGLLAEAERYLRDRGAEVIYCGGQYPLNPFYWGIYGGSEFAGVLASDETFTRAATVAGFEPAATTLLLEADLAAPEPREPRLIALRRQYRVTVEDDAPLPRWWDALAIGLFRPTSFELADKHGGPVLARCWTWDIASGFAITDGRTRTALINLEVEPTHRRRGLGKLIVLEAMKHARSHLADLLCVQTSAANSPALALYGALGFHRVETATLYRRPG